MLSQKTGFTGFTGMKQAAAEGRIFHLLQTDRITGMGQKEIL